MNAFYPFEIPIWGFVLNQHKLQSIDYIKYITYCFNNVESVIKSNRFGWQSNDFLHETPLFKELFGLISGICEDVAKTHTKDNSLKGFIHAAWSNVNCKNSFNLPHTHEGDLSGVLYLKVPKNSGQLVLMNPALRSYSQKITLHNYKISPEPLALIIFPSWLEHYVEPNQSDEKRISISFNFKIKDNYEPA